LQGDVWLLEEIVYEISFVDFPTKDSESKIFETVYISMMISLKNLMIKNDLLHIFYKIFYFQDLLQKKN